jgi:serine protease Do
MNRTAPEHNRTFVRLAAAALGVVLGSAPYAPSHAERMRVSDAALIRTLLPSVVNISSRKTSDEPLAPTSMAAGPESQAARTVALSGSGFVVDPQGIIATNYHVIGGAFEIIVTFHDGSRAPAKLLAGAKIGDIAVLKVDVGHPLPPVHWGNSDQIDIGDPVIAIGNPLGIGMSVTSGIVSALNRDIMASPYDDFIQTDAPINHGNSGGPLFNSKGEVVGIDTALYSPTSGSVGLGFAIPANDARFVIGRLVKYGAVRPGWIGVSLQQVTPDIADAIGMAQPVGAILSDITPASPADKAGLRVGDVIVRIGSKPAKDTRAVMRAVAVVPAGASVSVDVWRGGQEKQVTVVVQEMPAAPTPAEKGTSPAALNRTVPPDLGLQIASLDNEARNKYGIDFYEPGVLVTAVARNTDAAERGITAGDIILQIQDRPVASPEEFHARLNEVQEGKRSLVLVLVRPRVQPDAVAQMKMQMKGSPGLHWGTPKWVALRVRSE